MDKIKNEFNKAYRGVAEKLMGDMTESTFLTKGQLMPEEFVFAGDALIAKCPTWSWEGGKDSRYNKSLPDDKQFLIIRDVPCRIRAKDLMDDTKNHIEETEDEDGWVVAEQRDKPEIEDFDKEDEKKPEDSKTPEDDDDEIEDIEDELNSDSDGDDNIFAKKADADQHETKDNDEVVKCRRYNISLTYDKYYATPRIWLQGYDENKKALDKQMFEDVMAEHAKKTVTLEKHTNLGGAKQATIHP
jgi:ubiquitin-like-conjugating enzyme ATG3